jgi:beta-galactosidase
MKTFAACAVMILLLLPFQEDGYARSTARESASMDTGWRFALGHSWDVKRDFDNGSGYFSYFAKAGYGDGPAATHFDDRGWRILDVPHDWCVELPFDTRGGYSHGYRAMGRNFPEHSVGWYRKKFFIPASDTARRISIEFDGVFRNSIVWVNGFYCGTEHSGYTGFAYDITEYLNVGGDNVVAVRVDATMEEGWFYEGAGIYRHVKLSKTSLLHVDRNGTFITSAINARSSVITARTTVVNESHAHAVFTIEGTIIDARGRALASATSSTLSLDAGGKKEFRSRFTVTHPALWSVETPNLHTLRTVVRSDGRIVDEYDTPFGIRTVRFDPDKGFFLNGKHVMIKGTNIHQDHAGIGVAVPGAVQEFRIRRLKDMGSNAIRTAHHPPSTELLDVCDRLGMLVLDENRLMGVNEEHSSCVERFMKRDRNHPSVILWSLGNEEWAIEGTITGARIAQTMLAFAERFDSTRGFTVAVSGGWDNGIGRMMPVMGYNYIVQGNIDEHHRRFPWQAGIGTEESNTGGTRGVYVTNDAAGHMAPRNRMPENVGTESGWKFYAARPFLSGLFYWTGFDYRGEMHPYDWPAVSSQFGLLDACGFPKDISYYLSSWWGAAPVLHIVPDWYAKGRDGIESTVTVYSNCGRVELFIRGRSLGMKTTEPNGHLEWHLPFGPGIVSARGYTNGILIKEAALYPPASAVAVRLQTDRPTIDADGYDVSVVTVAVVDADGNVALNDSSTMMFTLDGPGKIIGVGNGDPSSHEPDKYIDAVSQSRIRDLKECAVADLADRPETAAGFDDSSWKPAFQVRRMDDWRLYVDTLLVIRGSFDIADTAAVSEAHLFTKSILERQSVFVNGHLIAADVVRDAPNQAYTLDRALLRTGSNVYAVTGQRFRKKYQWDEPNTDPGMVQIITHASQWKRKVFNGLAQVLVQSAWRPGQLTLKASAYGLRQDSITIQCRPFAHRESDRTR